MNSTTSNKALFIVFEGIDGSGTSTQAEMLKNHFLASNRKMVVTCEPSNGPIGHLIREGMSRRVNFSSDPKDFDLQMAYLFAADRHDHLYNETDGVQSLLKKDIHVVSTRYYFSSFAYHCSCPEDFEFIELLNNRFPEPDLVIYIDIPVEIAIDRIKSRTLVDIYENSQKLSKVKVNYENVFSKYSAPLLRVQGIDNRELIHKQIVDHIERNLL